MAIVLTGRTTPLAVEKLPEVPVTIDRIPLDGEQFQNVYIQPGVFELTFQTAHPGGLLPDEPETVYVDEIETSSEWGEGKGVATAALSCLLQSARANDYRYVRMGIIAPALVRVTEKLVALGYGRDAYYKVAFQDFQGEGYRGEEPTAAIVQSPDVVSAEFAKEFMSNVVAIKQAEMEQDEDREVMQYASISCVIEL